MDGSTPLQPPITLVRRYKRLPQLSIPTIDSIRAKGASSSSQSPVTPVTPSPLAVSESASTQNSLRAPRRSRWRKMDHVLSTYGFDSLGEFLSTLFHVRTSGEKDPRSRCHRQTVAAFLQGQSKIAIADIIPLIYTHHKSRPKRDTEQFHASFSPSKPLTEIRYARPCLSAWATRLVGDRIYSGIGQLARKSRTDNRNPRHVRASANIRSNRANVVEWEDIHFSIEELAALYKKEDEFLWYITECCAATRKRGKIVIKKTRPHPVIQVGAISSFITSRNRYASGDLGLPLGLWLFACQAHIDVKRVFCRFGYCVSDSTTRNALNTLTDASFSTLRKNVQDATARGETEHAQISDNIQRYERVYEHGLGKENVLKHGTACTVLYLEDCKPGAFRADDHIARIIKQERQSMTADSIFSSIDWDHVNNITELHFVRVLVNFSPSLKFLSTEVSTRFRTTLAKHRLVSRKARLQPLSTNSEQQMENKGYQAGFRDFDKQMGIEPEKSDNLLSWNRGDGGTHGTLMRLKRIQVTNVNIYESFRNAISTVEWWHTKATNLNNIASNHYGLAASPDPSSLSRSSNAANMKRPVDLKKCDFYPTSRSMRMIWEARVLDCWRLILDCETDLLSHFSHLAGSDDLPTLDDLLNQASILRERYACQSAYDQSLDKSEQDEASAREKFPEGSNWIASGTSEGLPAEEDTDTATADLDDTPEEEEATHTVNDPEPPPTMPEPKEPQSKANTSAGPKIHHELPGFNGDRVLSNAILFLVEFGWWTELNYAIPEGDVGRVLEILKIFIFSFGGSSNQNYMRYMLDLYALLEFESSPELKEALMNNWLLNLRGEVGVFVEGDLTQEWNNRWLQEFSGQRGGDFDDEFYRKTVAPNVLNFLRIKANVESGFELKRRSKSHKLSHLRDETKILLQLYREEELHSFRSRRTMGHAAVNQFDRGYQRLDEGKLQDYLDHSAEYATLLSEMEGIRRKELTSTSNAPTNFPSLPTPVSGSTAPDNSDDSNSESSHIASRPPSSIRSSRSFGSDSTRAASNCVEGWDHEDHSDEPLLSGSDLTVIIDPECGALSDDWYGPEEFENLLERLCGAELQQISESEEEDPETDDPESESEGEDVVD